MIEITNENFDEMLSIIRDSIRKSCFIAIDTELTGLVCNEECIPSLFDTSEERYSKQRQSINRFIVCQFGLSVFSRDQTSNIYQSKTYSFYLCPRFLANRLGSIAIDVSAITFLSYNQFDFQKFIKYGISYMNEVEEQDLRNNFDKYLVIDYIECPLHYEHSCQQLSDWLSSRQLNNNCGHQLVLKCKPTVDPLLNFSFLMELNKNFSTVWVQEFRGKFVAKLVDMKERFDLMQDVERQQQVVINQMVGFSSVFKCLVEAKRPIVGHNMIMDLLHIYHHFYKPLPKKLNDFKSSLHSLFPYIYDTKCILFNERQNLIELSHIIKNTSLGDMYLKLIGDEILNSFINSPRIEQFIDDNHSEIKEFCPHNAGFDAFATGFVFLKIGDILRSKNIGQSSESLPHSWFEFLKSIESHCNKVNLIRANTHYMCISGADPSGSRPNWLFARQRFKDSNFSMSKVTSTLSSVGTTDIRMVGNNSVLIAASSHGMAKAILDAFRSDTDIKVTEYNVCKHNRKMRLFLWTTFTISSCFTAVMTYELMKC